MSDSTPKPEPLIIHDLFSGTMAGCSGLLVCHPMDLIKVRMQTAAPGQYTSMFATMRNLVANEGVGGFYKGIAPPLASTGAVNAVVFAVYGGTLRYLERDLSKKELETGKHTRISLAAGVAGFATCFISGPVELIKCQQQVFKEGTPSTMQVAKSIIKRQGSLGLFRGWSATVGRDVPAFMFYFLTYEYVKDALTEKPPSTATTGDTTVAVAAAGVTAHDEPAEPSSATVMTAGAVAGLAAWVFVYPIDTVKSLVQCDTSAKGKGSWVRLLMQVGKEKGWGPSGPLWRGFGAMLCRTVPMNAVTFLVYERTMAYLAKK